MKLHRFQSSPECVLGRLMDDGQQVYCFTAELPWKNNIHGESCIPNGTYKVVGYSSHDHPNVWKILNVPNRSDILFHSGNVPKIDSKGCIIVGSTLGVIDGYQAVLDSRDTMDMLRKKLPNSFMLTVEGKL